MERKRSSERNRKTRHYRVKYFGKDGADRMETDYQVSEEKVKKVFVRQHKKNLIGSEKMLTSK